MNAENAIEAHYRALNDQHNIEYIDLYNSFKNEKLRLVLSTLHSKITKSFEEMNQRLPTGNEPKHFWAEPSRSLLQAIEISEALERSLKTSEHALITDEYHKEKLSFCKSFLSKAGGSQIPPHTEKMDIYHIIPIFKPKLSIFIESNIRNPELKLIGNGSYANVYKYKDNFYKKTFAVKRANKSLNQKEKQRFLREYEVMRQLKSPYILEVFSYNEIENEYIMEYMDTTLNNYIIKNNTNLSFTERQKIGLQILKAFSYIHSKGILHRDISPNNILIKEYDDAKVIKISDFGLVKEPSSELTTQSTLLKGYFNDPGLSAEGFNQYNMHHETYALTRVLYFVLTGKTITTNPPEHLESFIQKGTHIDKSLRFQSTEEIKAAFTNLTHP